MRSTHWIATAVITALFMAPMTATAQKPTGGGPSGVVTADASVDDRPRRGLGWWRNQGLSTLMGPHVAISPVLYSGGPTNDAVTGRVDQLAGFRYEDHGGIIAGLLLGVSAMFSSYVVAGMPDSVTSTSTTSTNYHGDGTATVTTTTYSTATYNNLAERQQMIDAAPGLVGAGALVRHQTLQIEFFRRDLLGTGYGDGYGYRTRLLFPIVAGRHFWLEGGVGFSSTLTLDENTGRGRKSVVRGTPLFAHIPFGWSYATIGIDMNWSSLFFDDPEKQFSTTEINDVTYGIRQSRRWPLTVGLTTNLWMFQLRTQVVTDDYSLDDLGYELSLGLRF